VYWTDASALYQLRYYNDNTVKGMSAEKYLVARLQGASTENADTIARESE
jgi:hypothetical protein